MRIPGNDAELDGLRAAAAMAGVTVPEFVVPTDQDVILRRMRFHYLDWGSNGKPILFLHGGGLNAHTYDLVCLGLRSNYHCISLDLRGHGDSEWSPVLDYALSSHAADISAFADFQGWERFVLVGMSLGGLNTIVYAASSSPRLAGAVVIDVGPELRSAGTGRIRKFMLQPNVLDSVDEYVLRALVFNPRRDANQLRRSLLHNLRQRPDGKWTWKYDPRPGELASREAPRTHDLGHLWGDVARIDSPVLVVRGAESDVFSAGDAEKLVSRLRNGRLRQVANAGHTVQGDNPAALTSVLTAFLAEIGY